MQIFIGWSGERSRLIGQALKEWLPLVLQVVKPWMSEDIHKGARWSQAIADQLSKSKFGIFCVTPENQKDQWINFEAGAISKLGAKSRVCAVLYQMRFADVTGPLAAFQHTEFYKAEFLKLVISVNAALPRPLEEKRLKKTFEAHWASLEEQLEKVPKSAKAPPERSVESMVQEVLEVVRGMELREIGISDTDTQKWTMTIFEGLLRGDTDEKIADSVSINIPRLVEAAKIAVFEHFDNLSKGGLVKRAKELSEEVEELKDTK